MREIWEEGPSLRASMLRHWVVIVLTAITLGATAYFVIAAQDPVYQAVAELSFADFHVHGVEPDATHRNPVRFLQSRVAHIQSSRTMERASEELDGRVDPYTLQANISVYAEPEVLDSVFLLARAGSADDAAAFANAVSEAYEQVAGEQRRQEARAAITELDDAIGRMEERIAELDAADDPDAAQPTVASTQRRVALTQLLELSRRRERLEVLAEVGDAGVTSLRPALPPEAPIAPRPKVAGVLGTFLGLAFASAYAYWREGHSLASTADDIRGLGGVPLLAEVPRSRDHRRPWSRNVGGAADGVAPSYDFLALAVNRTLGDRSMHSVVFAGVRGGHRGDASVAMNAALALCQEHRRVLLVDADPRGRKLTSIWHLDESLGLADLHDARVPLQRVTSLAGVVGGDATWAFVPAGRRQDGARLRPSTVQRLLQEVNAARRDGHSVRVVLHGPPVLDVADVSAIARLVDGVVLTVFARASVEDVRQAVDTIEVAGGHVLGFVFVSGWRPGRRRSAPALTRSAGLRNRSASVS